MEDEDEDGIFRDLPSVEDEAEGGSSGLVGDEFIPHPDTLLFFDELLWVGAA